MTVSTETVAVKYLNPAVDVEIPVPIPMYRPEEITVLYGDTGLVAVQNTDYTYQMLDVNNFFTIKVTPRAPLIAKILALIAANPEQENFIVVRRVMNFKTSATAAYVRDNSFTSFEFDRTAMRFQQIQEKLNRAVVLSPAVVGDAPILTMAEREPGRALIFGPDGNTIIAGPNASELATVVDEVTQLIEDATQLSTPGDNTVSPPKLTAAVPQFIIDQTIGKHVATAPQLVQRKLTRLIFGSPIGGDTPEIYPGAQYAMQGHCVVVIGGTTYRIAIQRCVPPVADDGADERCRYVLFPYKTDGTDSTHISFSLELNVGHGQDVGATYPGGALHLLSRMAIEGDYVGANIGKGFSETLWNGALTSQTDVKSYQVFGLNDTAHPLSAFTHGTVSSVAGGDRVAIVATSRDDGSLWYFEFDLAECRAAGVGAASLAVEPKIMYCLRDIPVSANSVFQGLDADNEYSYTGWGYFAPLGGHSFQIRDRFGNLKRTGEFDNIRADYGIDNMLDNPDGSIPRQIELEGACIYDNILQIGVLDTWQTAAGTSIVTFDGDPWNYACVTGGIDTLGISPRSHTHWVRTKKAATAGAWDIATDSYTRGSLVRRDKYIYGICVPSGLPDEKPLNSGVVNRSASGGLTIPGRDPDLVSKDGDRLQWDTWNENGNKRVRQFALGWDYMYLYDGAPLADQSLYSRFLVNFRGTRRYLNIGATKVNGDSGGNEGCYAIQIHGNTDSVSPGSLREFANQIEVRKTDANGLTQWTVGSGIVAAKFNRGDTGNIQEFQRAGATKGAVYASTSFLHIVAQDGVSHSFSSRPDTSSTSTPVGGWYMEVASPKRLRPAGDGTQDLGQATFRINNSFFAVAPTVTSDRRMKTEFEDFTEAEAAAILDCVRTVQKFKMKSAVEEKGEWARFHAGVIAQTCLEIFENAGLDPWAYAWFGKDYEEIEEEYIVVEQREQTEETRYYDEAFSVVNGKAVKTLQERYDVKVKTATVPVYDENGNPVMRAEPRFDEAGKAVRDADGQAVIDQVQETYTYALTENVDVIHTRNVYKRDEDGEIVFRYSVRYEQLAMAGLYAILNKFEKGKKK